MLIKTVTESEEKITCKNKEIEEKILEILQIYSDNAKVKMDNDSLKKENVELNNSNKELKTKLVKADSLSRKRNERIKYYQKKIKDYFSPVGSTQELKKICF